MKIKLILAIIVVIFAFIIGYVFGFHRATKNTEFMLSAYSAKLSMVTLKHLEDNDLKTIRSIHSANLHSCIAGVKSAIEMEKHPISNLSNLYYVYKLYGIDYPGMVRVSDTLFKEYEKYKE